MKIIVARQASNKGIGIDNKLPWGKHKEDMDFFKTTTLGKTVVMGMKTFKSIGSKPLKDRRNLVVTTKPLEMALKYVHKDLVFLTLEQLIMYAPEDCGWWVIGGESIYKQLLPYCDTIYVTEINTDNKADTFFEIDEEVWEGSELKVLSDDATVYYYWRKEE